MTEAMRPIVVFNPGMGVWYVVCNCAYQGLAGRTGWSSASVANDFARLHHDHNRSSRDH